MGYPFVMLALLLIGIRLLMRVGDMHDELHNEIEQRKDVEQAIGREIVDREVDSLPMEEIDDCIKYLEEK